MATNWVTAGFDPTGATDNTALLQGLLNSGKRAFDAPEGTYLFSTPLNATGMQGFTLRGDGPATKIVFGAPGDNWDMTGSSDISIRHVAKINAPGITPDRFIKWMGSAASPFVRNFELDHVNVSGAWNKQALYTYADTGLEIRGGTWRKQNNGPALVGQAFDQLSQIIKCDANNTDGVTSAFATVATGQQTSSKKIFDAVDFFDDVANSNNVLVTLVTCGSVETRSCKFSSQGIAALINWFYCEGITHEQPSFEYPYYASGVMPQWWVVYGGGLNGNINYYNPFFLMARTAFMACAPVVTHAGGATDGGLSGLILRNIDLGQGGIPLLGLTFAMPASAQQAIWIDEGDVDCNGQAIVAAGSLSNQLVMRRKGTVTVPSGSADNSVSFPGNYTPPPPPPPPGLTVFWNSADKNSGIALSNSNLTATGDGRFNIHELVRANKGIASTSGKKYFEIDAGANASSVDLFGLQDASVTTADGNYISVSGVGIGLGYSNSNAHLYVSGFTPATGLVVRPPASQVLGFAFDPATGNLWIRDSTGWFGGGDPAAGTTPTAVMTTPGTTVYPATSLYTSSAGVTSAVTLNFGQNSAAPLAYAVPTGFSLLS